MSREIRHQSDGVVAAAIAPPNDFKERLVKLIPSEIITAYASILGLLKVATIPPTTNMIIQWVVFFILLVLTPVYLYFIALVKKQGQIIFTTIAFVIWVTVVGGPFESIMDATLTSLLGSIALILYTLLIPIFYKG
jgi:hypothetical protein